MDSRNQCTGNKTEEEKKAWLLDSWAMLDTQERFVFNKLLTGSFRVGVSQNLVIKALADITGPGCRHAYPPHYGQLDAGNYTYDAIDAGTGRRR